jgi:hypothetical protein
MALSELQRNVLKMLAANRSDESYMAGEAVLNRDWPRMSDDFDVFHDTDDGIGPSAERDIAALKAHGFRVSIDILIYGIVDADGRPTTAMSDLDLSSLQIRRATADPYPMPNLKDVRLSFG